MHFKHWIKTMIFIDLIHILLFNITISRVIQWIEIITFKLEINIQNDISFYFNDYTFYEIFMKTATEHHQNYHRIHFYDTLFLQKFLY